ncbi:helix-turn-helix transcriptional regulator [Marinoscillum sp. MHG1-6]|uniref:helix-turn-helix domain-containing protein n=1 Tax=Marinoscillum sp. MHG1-6 TaxID=2959627 RepID=UPI0021585529|nr:helix-turn-helix transcriptional regulator [Marinoscillum sp. MHG1-6]
MASNLHIQTSFLNLVKDKIDPAISFVDELAELLNVSKDSAYRRLRGETLLSFEEISLISDKYKVSVDGFLNPRSNESVIFNTQNITPATSYLPYLSSIHDHLALVNRFENKCFTYIAKDILPMHYYQFPTLSWFKSFFWQKTILNSEKMTGLPFDPTHIDEEISGKCQTIWNEFMTIPSIEFWSDETINITLRQIEYYFDIDLIKQEDALVIVDELAQMVALLREEARMGKKMHINAPNSGHHNTFNLYYNEIAIGDNTMLFQMDNQRICFLTYNTLSVLSTSDVRFCENIQNHIDNITQKSTLISQGAEKSRNRFFNRMDAKVQALEAKIKNGNGLS